MSVDEFERREQMGRATGGPDQFAVGSSQPLPPFRLEGGREEGLRTPPLCSDGGQDAVKIQGQ